MKFFKAMLSTAAALAFVPGAFAQTAPASAPATAPATAADPAPATGATYSDEDVQKYAVALVAVNKLQADATIPAADKQAKMAAAVQQSGVDVVKFNAITQAMGTDKALSARIQTAAAAVPR